MGPRPQELFLTLGQLRDIRDALYRRIERGLERENQQIKALPAYVGRPSQTLSGDVAALDTGGTKIRAAHLKFRKKAAPMQVSGPHERGETLLQRARTKGRVTDEYFFAYQAEKIMEIYQGSETGVGYCFSYPAKITADCNAILLKWTKGIQINKVVKGIPVGTRLKRALHEKGWKITDVTVLNDTVASLVAGALLAPEFTHHIGLIVGTGTNMAGYFPVSRISKLSHDERRGWKDNALMAVSLESGNFTPPYLTKWDDLVDASMPKGQKGNQRFEKAVSGEFLPQLFARMLGRQMCSRIRFSDQPDVRHIAKLRGHPDVGELATAVLFRSADLVAAALAGLIKAFGPGDKRVGILAEGSLFWKTRGYRHRVKQTLGRLVADDTTPEIIPRRKGLDANLVGAGCAALWRKARR